MKIILPVDIVNYSLAVHINTIAYYLCKGKINPIDDMKKLINNWDFNQNKSMENVT